MSMIRPVLNHYENFKTAKSNPSGYQWGGDGGGET